jgi:hypothetical protein
MLCVRSLPLSLLSPHPLSLRRPLSKHEYVCTCPHVPVYLLSSPPRLRHRRSPVVVIKTFTCHPSTPLYFTAYVTTVRRVRLGLRAVGTVVGCI